MKKTLFYLMTIILATVGSGGYIYAIPLPVADLTPPSIPTGLKYVSTIGGNFPCGSIINKTVGSIMADWDNATDTESGISHYEYVSFNPPNGWVWPSTSTGYVVTSSQYGDASYIPTEGTYGFMVRAVDNAGNKSSWTALSSSLIDSCKITFDFTAPKIKFLGFRNQTDLGYNSSSPIKQCGSVNSSGYIAWEWEASKPEVAPLSYKYKIISGPADVGFVQSTTDTHLYVNLAVAGTYQVSVVAIDNAGNQSAPALCFVKYRTTTPVVGPPTSKDQCKNNGWKNFNNPGFKNQGQCVSHFNRINRR